MGTSKWVMVDIEANGPCPGLFSMTEFGAIIIDPTKDILKMPRFYGKFNFLDGLKEDPQAVLAISGDRDRSEVPFDKEVDKSVNRYTHSYVMEEFKIWLQDNIEGRPLFVSDNNGFDWQFINYYFWKYIGENPFGHSSTNMGSLYKGLIKNARENFKHLREAKHTHHPVMDCFGNVQALMKFGKEIGGLL